MADNGLVKIGVWPVTDAPARKKHQVDFSNNTIDGVPLRKLYIKNVPTNAKREQLYPLFTPFGPVEHINVFWQQTHVKSYKWRGRLTVFVTYKFSKDAMSALKAKFVHLGKARLGIAPAFAYCQPCTNDDSNDEEDETPNCDISSNSESVLETCKTNNDAPIENLDDYCLRHIFGFLPHIERIKIERVCKRWKSVARGLWRMERHLDMANGIPFEFPKKYQNLLVLKQIFKRCGASLKKLNLQGVDIFGADGLIESIMSKCLQLEELRLQGQHLNTYKINMLKPLKNLKVLALRDCNPVKDFNLKSILGDKSLLTHLEVTCSQFINGSFLQSINSPLETLNLSSCEKLNAEFLYENLGKYSSTLKNFYLSNCESVCLYNISKLLARVPELQSLTFSHYPMDRMISLCAITNLKHLETLNVSFNRSVTCDFLKLLVQSSQQLKSLDISGLDVDDSVDDSSVQALQNSFCISSFNKFKNLRTLNLSYVGSLDGDIIRKYASKSPAIESLSFVGCLGLMDSDIESLFSSCHQLKHLDLSGCILITEKSLKAANEAVSLRTNNQPLQIIVGGTKISHPNGKKRCSSESSSNSDESSESSNKVVEPEKYHPLLDVSYRCNCNLAPEWLAISDGFLPNIALGDIDDWFRNVLENDMYFDSDSSVFDFFDGFDSDTDDDDDDDDDEDDEDDKKSDKENQDPDSDKSDVSDDEIDEDDIAFDFYL